MITDFVFLHDASQKLCTYVEKCYMFLVLFSEFFEIYNYFLNRGTAPKDRELLFIGGVTSYKKGLIRIVSYKPTLAICTKDHRTKIGNAIRSRSFSTTTELLLTVVNLAVTRDYTT